MLRTVRVIDDLLRVSQRPGAVLRGSGRMVDVPEIRGHGGVPAVEARHHGAIVEHPQHAAVADGFQLVVPRAGGRQPDLESDMRVAGRRDEAFHPAERRRYVSRRQPGGDCLEARDRGSRRDRDIRRAQLRQILAACRGERRPPAEGREDKADAQDDRESDSGGRPFAGHRITPHLGDAAASCARRSAAERNCTRTTMFAWSHGTQSSPRALSKKTCLELQPRLGN